MKKISFLPTLSRPEQRSIIRWANGTVLLCLIMISSLAFIQYRQWQTVSTLRIKRDHLKQKVTQFETTIAQQRALKQEREELAQRIKKIEKYAQACPLPEHLEALSKACNHQNTAIESLTLDRKSFELQAQCARQDQIMQLLELLSKAPYFDTIALVSLQAAEHTTEPMIRFTIKGAIKK